MKTLAVILLCALAFNACDNGEHAPDLTSPPMCEGYLVTTQYPGKPTVNGMPIIGCIDDKGIKHDACLYLAGNPRYQTLSLCSTFPVLQ